VLIAPEPLARSAGGITLTVQAPASAQPAPLSERPSSAHSAVTTRAAWQGDGARAKRFDGLRFDVRVSSSRRQAAGRVPLSATPRADRLWAER
jgi:hypothetical protein